MVRSLLCYKHGQSFTRCVVPYCRRKMSPGLTSPMCWFHAAQGRTPPDTSDKLDKIDHPRVKSLLGMPAVFVVDDDDSEPEEGGVVAPPSASLESSPGTTSPGITSESRPQSAAAAPIPDRAHEAHTAAPKAGEAVAAPPEPVVLSDTETESESDYYITASDVESSSWAPSDGETEVGSGGVDVGEAASPDSDSVGVGAPSDIETKSGSVRGGDDDGDECTSPGHDAVVSGWGRKSVQGFYRQSKERDLAKEMMTRLATSNQALSRRLAMLEAAAGRITDAERSAREREVEAETHRQRGEEQRYAGCTGMSPHRCLRPDCGSPMFLDGLCWFHAVHQIQADMFSGREVRWCNPFKA